MKDYEQLENEVLNDKIRRFESEWRISQFNEQFRAEVLGRMNYIKQSKVK